MIGGEGSDNPVGTRTDAIVVLGRGPDATGRLPLTAQSRVERAVELYHAGVAPRIIASGRCGLAADEQSLITTEAAAMARAAIALGVPESAILIEDQSRDTIGNAYFTSRRYLEPNGWTTIRVVTSDYHIPRAAWVFKKILGNAVDVAFSPSSSELFAKTVAQRARQESTIAHFLMEWIGGIPDGDREAVDRLIREEHPAYGSAPTISVRDIDERVETIARTYRDADRKARGNREEQDRPLEL